MTLEDLKQKNLFMYKNSITNGYDILDGNSILIDTHDLTIAKCITCLPQMIQALECLVDHLSSEQESLFYKEFNTVLEHIKKETPL